MRSLLCSQIRVEKIIVNMVDISHGMRDIVVQVTDLWTAESENERGAIPLSGTWAPPLAKGPYLVLISRRKCES